MRKPRFTTEQIVGLFKEHEAGDALVAHVDGRVILVDEVLTPDSSRFWPADRYEEGAAPPSFDKQPLRDHLEREKASGRWNGDPPPPSLPTDVIDSMSRRYLDIYQRLTGNPLPTLPS